MIGNARTLIRDHPRMRGEHLYLAVTHAHRRWIIPACAGSTGAAMLSLSRRLGSSPHARGARSTTRPSASPARDHPRMRGEHEVQGRVPVQGQGIIPACAGSTNLISSSSMYVTGSSPHARGARCRTSLRRSNRRDHPRMRGEHRSQPLRGRNKRGSSPHARGAPAGRARAGSRTRDHPRMRGEHAPRGRGPRRGQGIIPACAGSTSDETSLRFCVMGSSPHARGALLSCWSISPRPRDHPRMRGEHLVDLRERYRLPGIIPACAGSTPSVLEIKTASAGSSPHARGARRPTQDAVGTGGDHPRMRGEHWGIE